MRVVEGELPEEALSFASSALGRIFPSGTTGVAGYTNGTLAVVVVLSDPLWGNRNIHIASAKRMWARKEFVRRTFAFAFQDASVNRLTSQVAAHNTPSLRLAHTLGFQLEAVLSDFSFGDMVVLKLLRRDLNDRHT